MDNLNNPNVHGTEQPTLFGTQSWKATPVVNENIFEGMIPHQIHKMYDLQMQQAYVQPPEEHFNINTCINTINFIILQIQENIHDFSAVNSEVKFITLLVKNYREYLEWKWFNTPLNSNTPTATILQNIEKSLKK